MKQQQNRKVVKQVQVDNMTNETQKEAKSYV